MSAILPGLVYLLCFLTSAACAWLLTRQYGVSKSPILLWSAACFVFLALANLFVVLDIVVFPDVIDLRAARLWMTFIAVCVLLFGFIWEVDE
jgi:hypothetical protein